MGLPPTIRVKLSSEAAEGIALTPVVVQELPIRELVEHLLGLTGKDEPRIRELLRRGTLVSGATRFRWTGVEAELEAIHSIVATFPDPDPARPFAAERCLRATLRGGRQTIEIPREAGQRKGLFQRATFWDLLMEVAGAGPMTYAGYSYRERADRYLRELSLGEATRLRENCDLLKFSTLSGQIRAVAFGQVDLWVKREE